MFCVERSYELDTFLGEVYCKLKRYKVGRGGEGVGVFYGGGRAEWCLERRVAHSLAGAEK